VGRKRRQMTPEGVIEVAVVGAHLTGQPLNPQLTERGATLVRSGHTAPDYQLYALAGTVPPKPGLKRVAAGTGAAIEIEIWAMPVAQFGSFMSLVSAPLGIGTLRLDDGSEVKGFICEPYALETAEDISHHGGWRAYLRAQAAPTS
jgi:allophanate hydrolase